MFHLYSFFFFNDTATTEIYTLSLHDALPILQVQGADARFDGTYYVRGVSHRYSHRSEEHTSELQSLRHLVCRLLLEKKKKKKKKQKHKLYQNIATLMRYVRQISRITIV